jgi:hypothetical protein
MSIANRGTLRRKMVLPVTIIRRNGEKQLAHTLDVTEISARLGGLNLSLEPGETVEIQRGGVKAKFHVYWTGEPGTGLEGQAGVRGIDPNKCIWSTQLPADEPDNAVDALHLRGAAIRLLDARTAGQYSPARYECFAGVNLRAPGSNYPFRAQLRNIHAGGFYAETVTTLPLNTVVSVEMQLEGIVLETAGMVTGSTDRIGMEISFHKPSPEMRRKLVAALQKIRQKAWDSQPVPAIAPNLTPVHPFPSATARANTVLEGVDAGRVLITLCNLLMADLDTWKAERTPGEVEELRKTVAALQERLAPEPVAFGLYEYLAAGSAGTPDPV